MQLPSCGAGTSLPDPVTTPVSPAGRSTFVTVVAWIFIVLAGFATLGAIAQNIFVALVFPVAEMEAAANQARSEGAHRYASWMFSHFQVFFLLFLAASASILAAAIGLLMRKNWARLLFVALLALAIAWNVAGLGLILFFLSSFGDLVPVKPGAENLDVMFKVMFAINGVFVVAFIWLFGWIIKRLASEEIRREFSAA